MSGITCAYNEYGMESLQTKNKQRFIYTLDLKFVLPSPPPKIGESDTTQVEANELRRQIKDVVDFDLAAHLRYDFATPAFFILKKELIDIVGNSIDHRHNGSNEVQITIQLLTHKACDTLEQAVQNMNGYQVIDNGLGFPTNFGEGLHSFNGDFKTLIQEAQQRAVRSGGQGKSLKLKEQYAKALSDGKGHQFALGNITDDKGSVKGAMIHLELEGEQACITQEQAFTIMESGNTNVFKPTSDEDVFSSTAADSDGELEDFKLPPFVLNRRKSAKMPDLHSASTPQSDRASTPLISTSTSPFLDEHGSPANLPEGDMPRSFFS